MRKTITFLLVTLAVLFGTATADAQSWPEGYQGDEFAEGQCLDFEAEIVEWLDRNPWGQRSPVGVQAIGSLCMDDSVLHFAIHFIVHKTCVTAAYSGGESQICEYQTVAKFREPGRILPWANGAYIAYVHEPNETAPYEAVVWDADSETGRFVDGVFDFVTPLWFFESEAYTRTVWEFKPRNGDVIYSKERRKIDSSRRK
jgi:hypothetical protein